MVVTGITVFYDVDGPVESNLRRIVLGDGREFEAAVDAEQFTFRDAEQFTFRTGTLVEARAVTRAIVTLLEAERVDK